MTKREYHKVLSNFYNRHHIINVIRPKYVNEHPSCVDFIDNYILNNNNFYDTKLREYDYKFYIEFYHKYGVLMFYYNTTNKNYVINYSKCENILIKKYNLNNDIEVFRNLLTPIMKEVLKDKKISVF